MLTDHLIIMIYKDKIYGPVKITEPVILELIKSKPLQRLEGIDQGGYYKPYFPLVNRNRFEHSLGVYILLNKRQVKIEEQIAGLIHDVSHTAFSHTTEYAIGGSSGEQNHQDKIHNNFIKQTEIPDILQKHNFKIEFILDDNNFPLKETQLPDLCADRIDYLLRDAYAYKEITLKDVKEILDNLITIDKKWVFKNFLSAQKFAFLFGKMNRKYYADKIAALIYHTVGDCIKYALDKKYLTIKDLYTTDNLVISKIKMHIDDKKLRKLFDRMNGKFAYEINSKDYNIFVQLKSRVVDPLFLKSNIAVRYSGINKKWGKIIQEESKPKKYYIKFITS